MIDEDDAAGEPVRREALAFRESVSVAMLATADADGAPHAGSAPYLTDEAQNIYVYVSGLARHTADMQATGRTSVLFLEGSAGGNPFARRRLSYQCRATVIARDTPRWTELLDRFAGEFGAIVDTLRALPDFQLFCLVPLCGVYVRGFGQAFRLSGPELAQVCPINPAAQSAQPDVATAAQILAFWYGPSARDRWFSSTPELDREITDRFGSTYRAAADGRLDDWAATPEGALALVIVLDQFPLNMFRGRPESFATEAAATAVALRAINAGFDAVLSDRQKIFLYMPLMHREDMADQDRAVALFEAAGLQDNLKWARHHRDIIGRFGRFPHRNEILGRTSTPAELEYLNSAEAFLG